MQTELKNLLTNLNPDEFSELTHAVSIAFNTRNKMKEHQITIPVLAEKTKLNQDDIFNFLCGASEYDFRTITKMELGLTELIDEKNGGLKLVDILKKEEKEQKNKTI